MANSTPAQVRTALANQLAAALSVVVLPYIPDQINPPVLMLGPGSPFATYGLTLGEQAWTFGDASATVATEYNLVVFVIITRAVSTESAQQVLDSYLGFAPSNQNIPGAIARDSTLGGAVDYCEAFQVASYGEIKFADQDYFGARVLVKAGVS